MVSWIDGGTKIEFQNEFENYIERKRPRGTDRNPQKYKGVVRGRETLRGREKKDQNKESIKGGRTSGKGRMMERSHNFCLSWSKGAKKFDHENGKKLLGEGSAEDSGSDDPALGLELDDFSQTA
jgi:hypothetical protein